MGVMGTSTQASAEKKVTPLLFGKRQTVSTATVQQYAGTDTERDLKL
jgi:hypothetical protein